MRRLTAATVDAAQRAFACDHPPLHALVAAHGPCTLHRTRPRAYNILGWSIVNQQLSARAAGTIAARILALTGERELRPAAVLAAGPRRLRACGLSGAKVRYLLAAARAMQDGRISARSLAQLPDEQVVARLVQVEGIGPWTAQMFLMFALRRADVFSPADIVLQRAVHELYGLPRRPGPAELGQFATRWRPYRTVAAWYLWKHGD